MRALILGATVLICAWVAVSIAAAHLVQQMEAHQATALFQELRQ